MVRKYRLVAAAAILLAGCAKAPEKPETPDGSISIAYAAIPEAGLVLVALARGFFEAEGLTVRATPFSYGKIALDEVIDGRADLATVGETPVVFAILGGEKIIVPAVISSSSRSHAIIADRAKGIAKAEDLAGKSIGVTRGTTGEYFLDSFLIAHGIDPRSVTLVDLPPERMAGSLMTGEIAAAAARRLDVLGISAALGEAGLFLYDDEIFTEAFCVAAAGDFARDRPETLEAFMRALIRSEHFMDESPGEARADIAGYSKVDEVGLGAVWDNYEFRVILDQALILILAEESRWALTLKPGAYGAIPEFLDWIDADALGSVRPDRVRLYR
ncbi:MAG: NrtA/SsuA/CpmA family ABC transporter substrate-binding protein [Spirochaetes bacterium]|nr:NrtA/SsuA/CpmA family ABC transporter substrate-binding protein [Spirochaetota bacterium]